MAANCFVSYAVLLPYALAATVSDINGATFFISSLLIAVAVMIMLYFLNVQKPALFKKRFWIWIISLAIAVTLQLTIVFPVIKF